MKSAKIILCTLLSTTLFSIKADSKEHTGGIVLTSEIVSIIDGFPHPWGIDAKIIKSMLHLRRELKKLQFGELKRSGSFEGHYKFHNLQHSIRTLAMLESRYEAEYYESLALYTSNREKYKQELQDLEIGYHNAKQQLRLCLEQSKKEFDELTKPFAKTARGGKKQMEVLIKESCQKRNRPDCFLLKWAEAPEDNESQLMFDQIITFKAMDQFCTDLTNFLEDLMRSCKKAWGQFKKIMDEQEHK